MKLTFVSLKNIFDGFKIAVKRFPIASLVAFSSTVLGLVLLHNQDITWLPNVLLVLALGFPVFVAIVLWSERYHAPKIYLVAADITAALFLLVYYLLLPENIFTAEHLFLIRYMLWAIGFILVITVIPYIKNVQEKSIVAFWRYNKHLVYSVALTIIWAGAIQAGLSIAMASIDFLFGIDIAGDRYAELWIVIVGVFSTTFFLSRIPKDINEFESQEDYPKELRLFSQYVLVPLVALYFLILYAYVIRILVVWEWPEGTLANMILGFSLLGVLTYVVLYPLRATVNWVRTAGTVYYLVLIPQVAMLFWALWFRISEYSFTENRYFVFVFGFWLLAMALYFLISKRKDIRIVPVTLFTIAVLSSFGPWSAFSVSESSQINRLEKILTRNNLLVQGTVTPAQAEVSFEDETEISAIVRYLNEVHGLDGIQMWFKTDFASIELADPIDPKPTKDYRPDYSYRLPEKVVEELIGLDYIEQWEVARFPEDNTFAFNTDFRQTQMLTDISAYDYMVSVQGTSGLIGTINGLSYRFEFVNDTQFTIYRDEVVIGQVDIANVLEPLMRQTERVSVDQEDLVVDFNNESIDLRLSITYIFGERENQIISNINSIDARLLFSLVSEN